MNEKEKNNKTPNNTEIEELKIALQRKDEELAKTQQQVELKDQEKQQIRQVLKQEEEKILLRKYGFDIEEIDNIRLMSDGEISESKLQQLKQKTLQRRSSAFISLLQDESKYNQEK
jgi:hypothetical protein